MLEDIKPWTIIFDPNHKNTMSYRESNDMIYNLALCYPKEDNFITGYMDQMSWLWEHYRECDNLVIRNRNGDYRLPNYGKNLEDDYGTYKCMNKGHNIYKMWKAGSFEYCKNKGSDR